MKFLLINELLNLMKEKIKKILGFSKRNDILNFFKKKFINLIYDFSKIYLDIAKKSNNFKRF